MHRNCKFPFTIASVGRKHIYNIRSSNTETRINLLCMLTNRETELSGIVVCFDHGDCWRRLKAIPHLAKTAPITRAHPNDQTDQFIDTFKEETN